MIGGTEPPETARTKESFWRWRRNRLIRRHVSSVSLSLAAVYSPHKVGVGVTKDAEDAGALAKERTRVAFRGPAFGGNRLGKMYADRV